MCGLTLQDFDRLRPEEFEAVFEAATKSLEQRERNAWERMRIAAAINVQPYAKRSITPAELVPLPWDNPQDPPGEELTREQILERFNIAVKEHLGNGKTGNI